MMRMLADGRWECILYLTLLLEFFDRKNVNKEDEGVHEEGQEMKGRKTAHHYHQSDEKMQIQLAHVSSRLTYSWPAGWRIIRMLVTLVRPQDVSIWIKSYQESSRNTFDKLSSYFSAFLTPNIYVTLDYEKMALNLSIGTSGDEMTCGLWVHTTSWSQHTVIKGSETIVLISLVSC